MRDLFYIAAFFAVFLLAALLLRRALGGIYRRGHEKKEEKMRRYIAEHDLHPRLSKESKVFVRNTLRNVMRSFVLMGLGLWLIPSAWGYYKFAVLLLLFLFCVACGLGVFDWLFVCPVCKKRKLVKSGDLPFSPARKYASRKITYIFYCTSCHFLVAEEVTVTNADE